ncbi:MULTISPECIES: hypothetical protein [unclassified Nocardia]|uniref:hypothetical protein n=1 Tax=unclassified Nocardia TaxID=2637762 RepID=UPI00278C063E|nr:MULTISPECIES: hypothetical protein [unclassified Nocardia]
MPPRNNTRKNAPAAPPEGRFYELQQEVAARRRGPYRLTGDIVIEPLTLGQAKQVRDAKTEDDKLRAVLGSHYEAVEALYVDQPLDEWIAFQRDLFTWFYGDGAVEVPGGSQGS